MAFAHKEVLNSCSLCGESVSKTATHCPFCGAKFIAKDVYQAAKEWRLSFNEVPSGIVRKLMAADVDAWMEQTPIVAGDRVLIYADLSVGTVKDVLVNEKPVRHIVESENGRLLNLLAGEEMELEWYGARPHSPVFWFPASDEDKAWVKSHMREVAECGFRVFSFDEWGLGITVNEYRYASENGLLPERIRDGCWMRLYQTKEGLPQEVNMPNVNKKED